MQKNGALFIMLSISTVLLLVNISTGASSQDNRALFNEAKLLLEADTQYLNARMKNKWETIYSFQNPDYRKAISIEEFKFYNGHVLMDYKKNKPQRISGSQTFGGQTFKSFKSTEELKKAINKELAKRKNFIGAPMPPTYKIFTSPVISIQSHKVEKIFLNGRGTLGKVIVRLGIMENLSAALRSPGLKVKRKVLYTDYWEKMGNQWVVAITGLFPAPNIHVSGSMAGHILHPVPIDLSQWEAAHYSEFKVEDLK